jgi:hypothetical protein
VLLATVGLSAVAYLVCYYGATGGSGVCCNHHAAVEETADNGRSRACRLGQRHALGVEGCIAVVVGEVEAAHGVGAELSRREACSETAAASGTGLRWAWAWAGSEGGVVCLCTAAAVVVA